MQFTTRSHNLAEGRHAHAMQFNPHALIGLPTDPAASPRQVAPELRLGLHHRRQFHDAPRRVAAAAVSLNCSVCTAQLFCTYRSTVADRFAMPAVLNLGSTDLFKMGLLTRLTYTICSTGCAHP